MEITITLITLIASTLFFLILIAAGGGIASLCGMGFMRFVRYAWPVLLVPSLLLLYGYFVGRNLLQIKEVRIDSYKLPPLFTDYRIVHISDLHLRSFASRHDKLAEIVDKVEALKPDMIVFTGDLVTLSVDETEGCMDILSRLSAPDGVFSVMGNHDYLSHTRGMTPRQKAAEIERLKRIEREAGWTMLNDSHVDITRSPGQKISIIGVENISARKQFPSHGNVPKALAGAQGDYKIMLSHDPTSWDKHIVGKTDIDLTLSGHTHETQFSLFGLTPCSLFYDQYKGLYSKGEQNLYVNIGLGETLLPARIGATPEITLITLHSLRYSTPEIQAPSHRNPQPSR
ncbi:MAG: metallophosphoesterase [Prevotella sp.]